MVDLPEPESPVNHSTPPLWPLRSARASCETVWPTAVMLVARRVTDLRWSG